MGQNDEIFRNNLKYQRSSNIAQFAISVFEIPNELFVDESIDGALDKLAVEIKPSLLDQRSCLVKKGCPVC